MKIDLTKKGPIKAIGDPTQQEFNEKELFKNYEEFLQISLYPSIMEMINKSKLEN